MNKLEKIEVNYKNKKRYRTDKLPIRQPLFLTWLIWLLSKIALKGKKYKIEKINMDGLKPPYIMLSNHMYFIDFELTAVGLFPHRMNNVINIDGYHRRPWLMELIGGIATRKFTNDLHLIKSIMHVVKKGDVVGLYPEARYSANGTLAYIPESVAKLVKLAKVPVVVVKHQGNHLHTPFWDYKRKRKVPLHTKIKKVLTTEEIKEKSVSEIYETIINEMQYDEYAYQRANNILIKEKYRAEGLHKILYHCPHCHTESKMNSSNDEIYCTECGKRWRLMENGLIEALDGNTEFEIVTEWYEWERSEVRKQIEDGTYSFTDDVEVYSFPRCWRFIKLGSAKVKHSIEDGFTLEGFYNGKPYRILRKPLESNGLHIEFNFSRLKPFDCFNISIEDDCYFCYPTKSNVITKLSFAVEELYKLHLTRKNSH
ncbi:MAG: 1-acyl-sn-glycerol-3-phosphate acyltransferase [Bacilli bacterium]|nr:1-acyl-sn-glycerol-3-phosphate acyltransferase [Bacilli bacterium]